MEAASPPPPDAHPAGQVKLDIFALPSQTTPLVILLIGVIYGTVIASSASRPALLLSVRDWLKWPERARRAHRLAPADGRYPAIRIQTGGPIGSLWWFGLVSIAAYVVSWLAPLAIAGHLLWLVVREIQQPPLAVAAGDGPRYGASSSAKDGE